MAENDIPDEDHLARYVKPMLVMRDEDTNEILGVFPQAFALRKDKDEEYLSANWLEYYNDLPKEVQIAKVLKDFKAGMTIAKTSALAIGIVGEIKGACSQHRKAIRVIHEPDLPHMPAHVAVRRYQDDSSALLELLASTAWAEIVPTH